MLAYVLALVVGLGSLAIYLAAFLVPEVHRKSDFIWSGIGLFYALVLWVCAGRMTGGVLWGQMASVSLLSWFGWQTLKLRWEAIPAAEQKSLAGLTPVFNTLQQGTRGLQPLLDRLSDAAENSNLPGFVVQGLAFVKEKTQSNPEPTAKTTPVVNPPAPDAIAPPIPKTTAPSPVVDELPEAAETPSLAMSEAAEVAEATDDWDESEPSTPVESEITEDEPRVESEPTPVSKLPEQPSLIERLTGVATSLRDAVQQILSDRTRRRNRPTIVIDRSAKMAETPEPSPNAATDDSEDWLDDEITDQEEELLLNNQAPTVVNPEAELVAPTGFDGTGQVSDPPTSEPTPTTEIVENPLPEPPDVVEAIAVEVNTPELDLAPPAEDPGLGDVTMREPEAVVESAAVTESPVHPDLEPSPEASEDSDAVPQLMRPKPPAPEDIAAAQPPESATDET